MRAVVLDEERTLALRDVAEPEPGDGQALVHVRAAGVNYADVLIREGRYPQPPSLPYVPGSEIAGETEDGRRVLAFIRIEGGGFAERAAADREWMFDLPGHAQFEEGAAFLLTFLTAWIPLTRQVPLRPGARVLVDRKGLVGKRYDGRDGTTYVLRPDQHVCARWRNVDVAQIAEALARATGHDSGAAMATSTAPAAPFATARSPAIA